MTIWLRRRRTRGTGGGGGGGPLTPSAAQTSWDNATFAPSANGIATAPLTYTSRTSGNAVIAGRTVSYSVVYTNVSASLSTVVAAPGSIAADGVETSTITITLRDASNQPLHGIPASQIVVAATGTGNTLTQPSGATNASGQITATLRSTVAATKVVSVTACGLAITQTASVVVGSVGGTRVAEYNWATATGNTNAALMDTGNAVPFNHIIECSGTVVDVMNVVNAAGAGLSPWPRTNALRLTSRGPTRCGNVEWSSNAGSTPANPNGSGGNGAPILASQSHYGRLYFRIEAEFLNNHGVAYNAGGTIQMVPIAWNSLSATGLPGGGTLGDNVQISFKPSFNGAGAGLGYPDNSWLPGIEGGLGDRFLALNTLFRYEWYVEYISALAYRFYPRVYNAAGDLLYDVNTFYQVNANPATFSLADYYAGGGSFGMTDAEIAREFSIGHEGPAISADNGANLFITAVAFDTGGWIGA